MGLMDSQYFICIVFNTWTQLSRVKRIRLAYNVAVTTDASGNLALGFETGNMVKSAPAAWQEIGGTRVPVEVSFTVPAGKESGFHVGAYDPSRPLIIDPTLT